MRRYVVGRALSMLALVALALTSNAPSAVEAQTAGVLAGVVETGFEGGSTGWLVTRAEAPIDRPGAQHSGARAAHIVATDFGAFGINTQYWLLPVSGRAEHTLRLWLRNDDPNTSIIKVTLEFLTSAGLPDESFTETIDAETAGWRQVTISWTNRETAAYARVSVMAKAAAAGATLYVDDVSLQRGPLLPALATPTAPAATAQPSPTASPSLSATAPPADPSVTATSTHTPTPSPAHPGPFDWLTNGGFEDGLYGWGDVGADVEVAAGGVRLTSQSTSTKYLYQIVRVTPGAWYAGSARLLLGTGVDEAWVRIAWYASAEGAGSQLSTGDSAPLTGGEGAVGEVSTGPQQAPLDAYSAAVRVIFRPLGSGLAQLTVDDVRFGEISAPPPPAPTAAPSAPTSVPPAASTAAPPAAGAGSGGAPPSSPGDGAVAPSDSGSGPRLVAGRPVEESSGGGTSSGGGVQSSSGGAGGSNPGATAPRSTASLAGFAPEVMLRITELMPDPPEPGSDREFEWVEVTNVGREPLPLAGITLRDNTSTLALPDIVLAPGVSLVVAGPRAAVPEASAFRPPEGLFNGLGNAGDRLALFTSDGRMIDALSYGSDTTYDDPPLPAPSAGRSLKRYFGDDGIYATYEVSDTPSPGSIEPPPARPIARSGTPATSNEGGSARVAPLLETGDSSRWTGWAVFTGLGVLALLAAGGQRLWTRWRGG